MHRVADSPQEQSAQGRQETASGFVEHQWSGMAPFRVPDLPGPDLDLNRSPSGFD
jgi:hypothetical protein